MNAVAPSLITRRGRAKTCMGFSCSVVLSRRTYGEPRPIRQEFSSAEAGEPPFGLRPLSVSPGPAATVSESQRCLIRYNLLTSIPATVMAMFSRSCSRDDPVHEPRHPFRPRETNGRTGRPCSHSELDPGFNRSDLSCGACGPAPSSPGVTPGDGNPETGMRESGQFGNSGVFHRKRRPATMYNHPFPTYRICSYEILRRWPVRPGRLKLFHATWPPTVRPPMSSVGSPTPTGTH